MVAQTEPAISARSAAFHLDWQGHTGTLVREAIGPGAVVERMEVSYLHAESGPAGYSKYLVWMEARDADRFDVLWCYLDDSGTDFWCWLYRYPANQVTTEHFTGSYHFTPLSEPVAASTQPNFNVEIVPPYAGPEFHFDDWTALSGSIEKLALREPAAAGSASTPAAALALPPARTLESVRVSPLHELHVGTGNGWRSGGWSELHALGFDWTGDPYYLILYSNSPHGYVIDLNHAQLFTADFGGTVKFGPAMPDTVPPAAFGVEPQTPQITISRYETHEFTFQCTHAYANPYQDVTLDVDIASPYGAHYTVPGFWDGGSTWKFRIAPMRVGAWSWKTHSNEASLDGKSGTFSCVVGDEHLHGFVSVQPADASSHNFAYYDTTPFYPAMIRDSASEPSQSNWLAERSTRDAIAGAASAAFQRRIDSLVTTGFDRLVSWRLLPACVTGSGAIDIDYFRWLDGRLRYCNLNGVVPDLGLARSPADALGALGSDGVRRLWRYILARYAGFDVEWDLFDSADTPRGSSYAPLVEDLLAMTSRGDPYRHPATTALDGPAVAALLPPEGIVAFAAPTASQTAQQPADNVGRSQSGSQPASAQLAHDPGMDVLSFVDGTLDEVTDAWRLQKPIVVLDTDLHPTPQTPAASPETARLRLWETRMRGGFWCATAGPDLRTGPLSDEVAMAAACARFFAGTEFSRLEPHQEMLNPPVDSDVDAARRAKALQDAGQTAASGPSGPIFVLADPAWEYVIYFERGGDVTLDLLEATGKVSETWLNPRTGEVKSAVTLTGGTYRTLVAPDSHDWVLHLSRR